MPRPTMTPKRFWTLAKKQPTGCLEWTGKLHRQGYGRIKVLGKSQYTHRLAWMYTHGSIPNGEHVLHKCDNPPCVNPAHLFLGTHQDNMRDCKRKGRMSSAPRKTGTDVHFAKLSEKQVKNIRKLLLSKKQSQREIAEKFGVRQANISCIALHKSWKHI